MKRSLLPSRYAKALMVLTQETQQMTTLQSLLVSCAEAYQTSRAFRRLLGRPDVEIEQRMQEVKELLQCPADSLLMTLVRDLMRKGRTALLPHIAEIYGRMVDKRRGVVRVVVTSAVPLAPEVKQVVAGRVEKLYEGTKELFNRVDPDIIGGLVIQVGQRLVDLSVRAELAMLERELVATIE